MYQAAKTLVAKIDGDKRRALLEETQSIDKTEAKGRAEKQKVLHEKLDKLRNEQYEEQRALEAKHIKARADLEKNQGIVYDEYGYVSSNKTSRQKEIAKQIKAIDEKQNVAYQRLVEAIDRSVIEQTKINLEELLKG
jgi:hypothetical protein